MTESSVDALGRIAMSPNLAATLARAGEYARAQAHVELTLEHLLLALAEDADAALVLSVGNVDLARLVADVSAALGRVEERVPPERAASASLAVAADLRRVLEAAAAAAQQSRRRDINGAIVLAAIVGDGRSTAAHLLRAQGLTFELAIRALQRAQNAASAARPAPGAASAAPAFAGRAEHEPASTETILASARERVQTRAVPGLPEMRRAGSEESARVQSGPPQPGPALQPQPQASPDAQPPPPASPDQAIAEPERGRQPTMPAAPPGLDRAAPTGPAAAPGQSGDAAPGPASGPPSQPLGRQQALPTAPPMGAEPDAERRARPSPSHPPSPEPAPPPPQPSRHPGPAEHAARAPELRQPSWGPRDPSAPRPMPHPMPQPGPPASRYPGMPAMIGGEAGTPGPVGGNPPQPVVTREEPRLWPPAGGPTGGPGRASGPRATRGPLAPRLEPARDMTAEEFARELRAPTLAPVGERKRNPVAAIAGQLVENIPRRMRLWVPTAVEARIGTAEIQALAAGLEGGGAAYRHEVVITKAMSVRLRALDGGFWIETASPETQWIDNPLGPLAEDFAAWRWTVTPRQRGRRRLQLLVSARTVGADGLTAETALPDQVVEIKVRTNYGASALRWAGWLVAAVIGGLLAKFGEEFYAASAKMAARIMNGG